MSKTKHTRTGPVQGMEYVGLYWIPGVPARDLTAEEAEQYREQIEATERATGRQHYRPVYAAEVSPRGEIGVDSHDS